MTGLQTDKAASTPVARQMRSTGDRLATVAASMKKLGAATVPDLAVDTGYNKETCRRYLNMLIDCGAAELVSAGTTHVSSIYAPTEMSGEIEFDVCRLSTKTWTQGQGMRDPLVAALFGAPVARGVHL